MAKQTITPEPNEVVVVVALKRKLVQISIDPYLLVPWAPSEGNTVVVVGYRWIGQVGKLGKLVKLDHECCAVELAESGELSYFNVGGRRCECSRQMNTHVLVYRSQRPRIHKAVTQVSRDQCPAYGTVAPGLPQIPRHGLPACFLCAD